MHSTEGRGWTCCKLSEQSYGAFVLPLIKQPRCGVAMPSVRMSKRRNQGRCACASKMRQSGLLKVVRQDAVDPAAIVPAVQVEMLLDRFGQRPWVLHHFAIHVRHIECSVRR